MNNLIEQPREFATNAHQPIIIVKSNNQVILCIKESDTSIIYLYTL